jgi:predicted MFS family arabinose efflux permease
MTDRTIRTIEETRLIAPFSSFITPSLMLTSFLSGFPIMLLSLFITEMAQLFGLEVGMMGMVRSVSEACSVAMGVLLGGLSVRYRLKSLLIVGIAMMSVSSLLLGTTSFFPVFLVAYAVIGFSKVMLRSMSQALVGQFFTIEKRPKISGYVIVGMMGSYIVGSMFAVYVPDFRLMALLIPLPLSVVALLVVLKGIPSQASYVKRNSFHAFQRVLGNQSIVACLISNALAYMGINTAYLTFFMPFFLQTFQIDRTILSMIFMIGFILIIVGTLIGGRVVNRIGRKPLIVVTTIASGSLCFLYIFAPRSELSLLCWWSTGLVFGVGMPAYTSLMLEQAPEYKGTVMSLSEVSQFVAQAIGSGVGGLLLIMYGFGGLGVYSLSGVVAGIIYYFFAIDPTQKVRSE